MEQPYICLRCCNLEQEEVEGHWVHADLYIWQWKPKTILWYCHARHWYVRTIPQQCKDFSPLTQTKLKTGDGYMVKIDEIPSEGLRLDIAELPEELDLKAVDERMKAGVIGSPGGLIIKFITKDGRTFEQKYHKVAGAELAVAMKKLGLKDTKELQEGWYHYVLTSMRIGFARMIPVAKVK